MKNQQKKSVGSISYKSEENLFGLKVRIRDNGRESYQPDVLK